jgi:TPR repeat protein
MYDSGRGLPQDYKEAVKLYRLAAVQGLSVSQNNLGNMYLRGKGVPQDYVRASMWFDMAATQGDALAILNGHEASERMTPQQVTEAQVMAQKCKASGYKQCE